MEFGICKCRSFLISLCMLHVSTALLMSRATVIVRAGGVIWLKLLDIVLWSAFFKPGCVLMWCMWCMLFAWKKAPEFCQWLGEVKWDYLQIRNNTIFEIIVLIVKNRRWHKLIDIRDNDTSSIYSGLFYGRDY